MLEMSTSFVRVAAVVALTLAAGALGARQQPEPTSAQRGAAQEQRGAAFERRLAQEMATPRPIPAVDSVWIEDLTWMELRDALAAGKRTVIVPTGGVEQNGPYLVTGKHNVILRGSCEGIARALGDALCAPIVAFVPEGSITPPSGHMLFPGTLSLREETYEALLDDIASSLRQHGFEQIVLIGDSGGNQHGLEAVAARLNERWGAEVAHYIPEYYEYQAVLEYLEQGLGIRQPIDEGLHDDYAVTAMMAAVDPGSVRLEQRVAAGKATINGVSIVPIERTIEVGRKLLAFRVEKAVAAIRAARGER